MKTDEVLKFTSKHVIRDFETKVLTDTADIVNRNINIFFGNTLPVGLGHFLAMRPLAGVLSCIILACLDDKLITEEGANELTKRLASHIRTGK